MQADKTILIVDDSPANVSLLNAIIKPHYKTKIATSGEKALQLAASQPTPDLILLDIMMPGMDGYAVCKSLKQNTLTRKIPIIFVTALGEVKDETRGFQLGAVDYITKPFSPPVVLARVRTHIELSETRVKLFDSLQKTLLGSVRILTDLLAVSNPEALSRALRLKTMVRDLAEKMDIKDAWKYEVAASLSQLGCMFLPPQLMEKIHRNETLTNDELALYRTYPEKSCELLLNIPHLEESAEIIKRLRLFERVELFNFEGDEAIGNALLQGLVYYDEQIAAGALPADVLQNMRAYFPTQLVSSMEEVCRVQQAAEGCKVTLGELEAGMVLVQDLVSDAGSVVVPKGTTLTAALVSKLKNSWQKRLDDLVEIQRL